MGQDDVRGESTRRGAIPATSSDCPLLGRMCGAFDCRAKTLAESLRALAQHGFLLLDSVPFAMDYSGGKRGNRYYLELVRLSATSYLHNKIESSRLSWSPDLRIAFALRLNAKAILKTVTHLRAGGRMYPLSNDMLVADARNWPPNSEEMKRAFGLNQQASTAS